MTPDDQLVRARKHLEKAQTASWDPVDWPDLCLYGFYALEMAVSAACNHLDWPLKRTHPAKSEAAKKLADEEGLPDVADLLRTLNDARKAEAYGDIARPDLDPQDVATEVEEFIEAVDSIIADNEPEDDE